MPENPAVVPVPALGWFYYGGETGDHHIDLHVSTEQGRRFSITVPIAVTSDGGIEVGPSAVEEV